MMFQLTYVSVASHSMSGKELDALLQHSREHNGQSGVTGLLLYNRGNFMQTLEGLQEDVVTTYGRIRADSRHTNLIVLDAVRVSHPVFSLWSMAFRNWNELPTRSETAVNAFFQEELALPPEARASAALLLLRGFAKSMQ